MDKYAFMDALKAGKFNHEKLTLFSMRALAPILWNITVST